MSQTILPSVESDSHINTQFIIYSCTGENPNVTRQQMPERRLPDVYSIRPIR